MKESTTKEKVLKKVRNALIDKSENPMSEIDIESDVYTPNTDDLEILFAKEFSKVNGKFVFCVDENEFVETFSNIVSDNKWNNIFSFEAPVQELLEKAKIDFQQDDKDFSKIEVGVTSCEHLVARLGSIMISSKQSAGRRLFFYPPVHIVVAFSSQLVYDLKDGINSVMKKYKNSLPSMTTFITGPSRTADIEKTLIMGAHGPKEVYVFLIDDSLNN